MTIAFAAQYLMPIEQEMRNIMFENLPDTAGFGVMLRYAMGWVDATDAPYDRITGKRLRPVLLLICNQAAGGDWKHALPAAASVEILHNFSLIHDDIQDNSFTRHGRPTVWKVWGEANAINAGDAMLVLAYNSIERLSKNYSDETVLQVWRYFNRTNLHLTRGQHMDMRFETQNNVTIDEYVSMIEGKSAALIAACAQIGAYLATEDTKVSEHYFNFGLNIGISFQIRDDVLGIWGDSAVTGKSTATDIISRKKSLPVLFALSRSEALRNIYAKADFGTRDVDDAIEILNELNARNFAYEQEMMYYERAMHYLLQASPSEEARQYIQAFVDFLFNREY